METIAAINGHPLMSISQMYRIVKYFPANQEGDCNKNLEDIKNGRRAAKTWVTMVTEIESSSCVL